VSWALGSADRRRLDQQTGLITWTLPEKSATAPAQRLANFSLSSGSWLWAWANENILAEMSRDARSVRDWAETHGHHVLAQPKGRRRRAGGGNPRSSGRPDHRGHRLGPGGNSVANTTFGPVTLTAADGSTSTFNINID
jgi:hypothetical protein